MTEKLSNILDEKILDSDLDDFLRECKDDPALIDSWQRYHIAGGVIRNEINELDLKYDVSSKVMDALKSEKHNVERSNVISFGNTNSSSFAKKSWLPLAVAASLLLGVYFIVQQPVVELNSQQVAQAPQAQSIDQWQTSSSAVEDTLNSLLVEHSEFTSITGMNGLGSYSKFIAYQN